MDVRLETITAEDVKELTYRTLEEKVLRKYSEIYKEYTKLVKDSIFESVGCSRLKAFVYESRMYQGRLPVDVRKLVEYKLRKSGFKVKYESGPEPSIEICWQ